MTILLNDHSTATIDNVSKSETPGSKGGLCTNGREKLYVVTIELHIRIYY